MTSHLYSLDQFRIFLEGRQSEIHGDFDPKKFRESLAQGVVGVGYVDNTLRRAYGANLRKLFPRAVSMNDRRWSRCDAYLGTGTVRESREQTHQGMERIFGGGTGGKPVALFEQGFVASAASWTHSFATGRLEYACLSYVLDDIAFYYMAEYPNRLIHKLDSEAEITEEERSRARRNMERLRAERISKYNAQPVVDLGPSDRPRVLVCDQTYADASTVYGLAEDRAFEEMLEAAIRENPGAEILVKTHPDTAGTAESERKRTGFYVGTKSSGTVRVVTEPMNPIALMEQVERVYVGTSGMGMDALIAGKDVVCFGAPFFAGWGVTDDRREIPHRHRKRSVEEIFHYFYIWYSHYATPDSQGPCELEDVIDYIVANRGEEIPLRRPPAPVASPRVSVVIPVHNVQAYVEPCLRSVLEQTLREIEILVVDDQSPDGSRAIVDAIASEDPRVRVLSMPENVGQGFARNAGLEEARGEYVWFIDSDDLMGEADALERLVIAADVDEADMVRARKHIRDERGVRVTRRVDTVERYFREEASHLDLVSHPELLQNNHFWNFLYRREFLARHAIRFELTQWEERPFLVHALLAASSITTCDVIGTIYRIRQGSTARRQKTAIDVARRQENIRLCLARFRSYGADDPASPLHRNRRYCASRSVALLFSGFQRDFILSHSSASERADLYDAIAVLLEEMEVRGADLVSDPDQVDDARAAEGYYALLVEACRAREHGLLDTLLQNRALTQRTAYALLAHHRADPLAQALNHYIRKVQTTVERASPVETTRVARNGSEDSPPALYLHVGSTKTGSTYIQHFCDLNRGALLAQGIYYPEFGVFSQEGRPHKTAGHSRFLPDAKAKLNRHPLRARLLAGIAAAPVPVHTVILSSEAYFLANDPTHLAAYLSPHFDVRVLIYLRRQDDWANSQYAEFVGGGAMNRIGDPPEVWLRSEKVQRWMDYGAKVDRWASVVDESKIIVRPYERSQWKDGDLLTDFFEAVGIPAAGPWLSPGRDRKNEMPLRSSHLAVMRFFNRMPFASDVAYLSFVEDVWTSVRDEERGSGSVELLGPALRSEVLETAESTNRHVARRYLGRPDGLLFEDLTPRAASDEAEPTIAVSDVQAILDAYLEHMPKPSEGGASALARRGLTARLSRKARKLLRNPAAFFRDSKSPFVRRLTGLWSAVPLLRRRA